MIRRPPRSTLFPTRRSSDLPVGTCVILDTYEVGIVHGANADVSHVHRPVVRIVTAPDGALLQPTFLADLAHRDRSEEHTSELQSQSNLVCRLLLEKKKKKNT